MSDQGTAAVAPHPAPNPPPNPAQAAAAAAANANAASKLFTELKASAHLMTFDVGLYCIVQTPGVRRPEDGSGLPGVRISMPPSPQPRPDVSFATFRPDGWLSGASDAMLVRVGAGPAQILVTIYQAPTGGETAPRLQVLRLSEDPAAVAAAPGPGAASGAAPRPTPPTPGVIPEVVAHAQLKGDIGAGFGEWVGDKGSKRWIEGFMLNPRPPIAPTDLEYQAVLGRGWLSPWVEGGQLCGSRGMALPVLGLRLRLRGAAAETHEVSYAATFVDGTEIGPVAAGEPCEAESLSPLESFQIMVTPKAGGLAPSSGAPAAPGTPSALPGAASAGPKTSPRGIRGKPAPTGKR